VVGKIRFQEKCLSTKFATQLLVGFVLISFFLSLASAAQQTPPPSSPAPSAPRTQPSTELAASRQEKNAQAQGQGTPPPASPQLPSDEDAQGPSGQGKVAGTSNDRLFFTLPNFLSLENGGHVAPLTPRQKFKVVFRGSFDYVQLPWYALLSGISQAENSEPGYGQGANGYAKRNGSAFADGTIESFMTGAILPSLLHQDPRFFQSSEGGLARRTGHAVSRILVTRTDSGCPQFNYSEILGSALAAAISTSSYHPRAFITVRYNTEGMPTYVHNASDRTLPNTASIWGTQIGYDTIAIVVKEFWPDIHRKLSHKHSTSDVSRPGNSNP
jgi:hypothetical protein